jgi:alpha-mannosidase
MKIHSLLTFVALLCPTILLTQPNDKRSSYNISNEKVLYTVGYSHLDTEWNWDYPTSINELIKNIMTENFHLFEKYPDYVFNFTGSRRYHMMKEYYPELYSKVKYYVQQGRWYVSGSSVDEGEVNMSSSESLIRQVLYGNNYFRKEFGTESYDYMLPDCFGFLANMPSIWNHCGLLGFSTQKLTWRSAVGVPFNVGTWYGPDGKGILAALNATDYTGSVVPRLDIDDRWNKRLETDMKKTGYSFDFRYYGVGDMGGAPREKDVKNVIGSLNNADSKFKVILTSSDQMFKDITSDIQKKLPSYKGDLLLIEHSAGSLTSQAFMKRMNRKNELLAQSAEQLAAIADWKGQIPYPFTQLNNAWELVLGSQFHDILPGTSIPKAYEYAWNDEFIAANGFADVLKNSVNALSSELNTACKGRAIVVYNPVAADREDIVTAQLEYDKLPQDLLILDPKGRIVPCQIIGREGNVVRFVFPAKVSPTGLSVFEVRENNVKSPIKSELKISDKSLENGFYKITLNPNGDIASIFDKKNNRELLSRPARLEFQSEESFEWPAWNMDWKERQKPPFDFMDKETSMRIVENGPVRVTLEVKRKGQNSEITQFLSLAAGDAGKRFEINNMLDWQSKGVSLKAAFPFSVSNDSATYNMEVGTIQRGNNNERKFEVPSKEWFDLTDKSSQYGISILEDCKYGSDKPDDNTLRLTLMFTPKVDKRYVVQGSQDWGMHSFKYGIYAHNGDWKDGLTHWQAKFLNQPLMAFETPKHPGSMGKSISFIQSNHPAVGIMAFKKAENTGYYIVRVNELLGKDANGVNIKFPAKIADAYEVNGQEKKIGKVDFSNDNINIDLSHFTIRSFAVRFVPSTANSKDPQQTALSLPYNLDAFSFDDNRDDGSFDYRVSMPAELIPSEIINGNIHFTMGSTADGNDNAVNCKGQKIDLPEGNYSSLYILAAAKKDTTAEFIFSDATSGKIKIQNWSGYIGQFYNRKFAQDQVTVTKLADPYAKGADIAWFASHKHNAYPSKNDAYQYCYIYKYRINLPKNAKSITLPVNESMRIFAITAVKETTGGLTPLQPLYDNFDGFQSVDLRNQN